MSNNNNNNTKTNPKAFGEGRLNGKTLTLPMRMSDFDEKTKWSLGSTMTINSKIPDSDEEGVTINHSVTYYKIETLGGEIPNRMIFVNLNTAFDEAWKGQSRATINQFWSAWKGLQSGFHGEAARKVRNVMESVEERQTNKGSLMSLFLFETKVGKYKEKAKKEMIKAVELNPSLASSWSESYIKHVDTFNDALYKEEMDNFVRKVHNIGCEASLGKNLEEILGSKTEEEKKKYQEDMDQAYKKAKKHMDLLLEVMQEGPENVPMETYTKLRRSMDHRGKFGKMFLVEVVRTIISETNEDAEKFADDMITYLQHYATKPYSWSARKLKDVLEIISRGLEYLPDGPRDSNKPLVEEQIKGFIKEEIPEKWKRGVALYAKNKANDLTLDDLMSYLFTLEHLEKDEKDKKELQKKLEKRNKAEMKAGGRKRSLNDPIPKKGRQSEFREKSQKAQRQNNVERLLCKLCYSANMPERVYSNHEDKNCQKFNADGTEKQSKKRKHNEIHNIEASGEVEVALQKAAMEFSKSIMKILSAAKKQDPVKEAEAHVMGTDADNAIEIDDTPMDSLSTEEDTPIDYDNVFDDEDAIM